jgi:hypothetical protein
LNCCFEFFIFIADSIFFCFKKIIIIYLKIFLNCIFWTTFNKKTLTCLIKIHFSIRHIMNTKYTLKIRLSRRHNLICLKNIFKLCLHWPILIWYIINWPLIIIILILIITTIIIIFRCNKKIFLILFFIKYMPYCYNSFLSLLLLLLLLLLLKRTSTFIFHYTLIKILLLLFIKIFSSYSISLRYLLYIFFIFKFIYLFAIIRFILLNILQ